MKENEVGETFSTHEGWERCLVERPDGKRPLERPRHRWEDNIKMDQWGELDSAGSE
jgi:hypothetical protein